MKVIRKRPGEHPEAIEIQGDLEELQREVGGHIEAVMLGNWCVLCDEEGRFKGYEKNCYVQGIGFVGTILFVGVAGEDFADVPQEIADALGVELC